MKRLIAIVIVALLVIAMLLTVPGKKAHRDAMMTVIREYVDEEAAKRGLGRDIFSGLGKVFVNNTIKDYLKANLQVNDYYLFNTTSIIFKGKERVLSLGILGQVFTFDKHHLRKLLEEAADKNGDDDDDDDDDDD